MSCRQLPGECEITCHTGNGEQYPYECNAKYLYPTDTVYLCAKHGTWWHDSLFHRDYLPIKWNVPA